MKRLLRYQRDKFLVLEVKKHPVIYDAAHRNKKLRRQTFEEIGRKIGCEGRWCALQWRSIRDRYVKEQRTLLNPESSKFTVKPNQLNPLLSFLDGHIRQKNQQRERRLLERNVANDVDDADDVDDDNSIDDYSENMNEQNSSLGLTLFNMSESTDANATSEVDECSISPVMLVKTEYGDADSVSDRESRTSNVVMSQEFMLPPPPPLQEYIQPNPFPDALPQSMTWNQRMDEDDHFCMSLAACLKRLSPMKKARSKIRILQLLAEAEFG